MVDDSKGDSGDVGRPNPVETPTFCVATTVVLWPYTESEAASALSELPSHALSASYGDSDSYK